MIMCFRISGVPRSSVELFSSSFNKVPEVHGSSEFHGIPNLELRWSSEVRGTNFVFAADGIDNKIALLWHCCGCTAFF